MAPSTAAASAVVLPLPRELVVVMVGPAVWRRRTASASRLWRCHVGGREWRRKRARVTAWRRSIAARCARARGIAHVVQHPAAYIGPKTTTHAALGQESLQLPILLGELLLVLRDIAVDLFQAE